MYKILFISIIALLTDGCAGRTNCTPGYLDGPWESIGVEPPPVDLIKGLPGKNIDDAQRLLTGGYRLNTPAAGQNEKIIWVFQKKQKTVYSDCVNSHDSKLTQSFLIISARVIGRFISGCSIQTRVRMGDDLMSVSEILEAPVGPLDSSSEACNLPGSDP